MAFNIRESRNFEGVIKCDLFGRAGATVPSGIIYKILRVGYR